MSLGKARDPPVENHRLKPRVLLIFLVFQTEEVVTEKIGRGCWSKTKLFKIKYIYDQTVGLILKTQRRGR